MHPFLKKAALISFSILLLVLGLCWFSGSYLSSPVQTVIAAPPSDLGAETITLKTAHGNEIKGWFIPANPSKGSVLLMHGVRSNRTQMLARARFLQAAGYSSLLFDFQAHGESLGEHITFGYLEQEDAWAAFQYLKQRLPESKIAVLGVSLGGAASMLSHIPQHADALILEATYSNLETAIANRLEIRLGTIGRYLTPLLTWQIKPRLGFTLGDLAPIEHISQTRAPVLVIAGENDQHTKLVEAEQMYNLVPTAKELWIIPKAAHVDFYDYAPQAYEQHLVDFLAKTLN